ncbi:MAG: hypothetical protein K8S24_08865 [Candidatus Aegiribacteria sp.]|nr:hypothetical protein [Candidatus Aegiribacteria sp.]
MKKVTVALTCPSCAGPLSISEGDTHTICPNCSSSLLLPNAVRRYVMPSGIESIQVLRSVRNELKKVNPGSVDNARVSKPVLYYVPFWHCTAQANGFILGVEPAYHEREIATFDTDARNPSARIVTTTKKIKTRTGSNAVEREIQLSGRVNISAADLEPLGIPTLSADAQLSIQGLDIQRNVLPEGLETLEDESSRDGVFVDPLVTIADAHDQTASYFSRLASGVGFGLEQRWEYIVISGYRDALIYYPLWITDFRTDSGSYQVVVDGRSGKILRGRFPSSGKDRKILTIAAALLWAGILPYTFDLLFSGRLTYSTPSGNQSSCLPIVLLILGAMVFGTRHILGILSRVTGRGNDHVIY